MKSTTQYARTHGISRQATLKRIKTGRVSASKVGSQYVIGKIDGCYRCKKPAKYITHTTKNGKLMKHARFTCEEHHYSL